MWRERGRVQNAGRNKDDCFIGQFVFMCMDRLENRAGECAAPSAGSLLVSHYYFTVWLHMKVSDMEMDVYL